MEAQAITVPEKEQKDEVSNIMAVIERCALNPQVDVDKMQKLLDMQERILNRNAKQAFAADMARMQAELPEIKENGKISIHGKVQSKYGLFEDINEAVKPVLQKWGFAISFRVNQSDNKIKVTAILSHQEGHSEETEMELPTDNSGNKNAVQAVGSSVAYGKRYTMCALLNITTRGEDDDGKSTDPIATLPQQKAIETLVAKLNKDKQDLFKTIHPDISQIKKSEVDSVMAKLNRTLGVKHA